MSIITYPNIPLLQEDLIGSNKNYYSDKAQGFTLGRNSNVDDTLVDLWEGPTGSYVFPTTPIQMRVVSSSANDAAAGTGARTVIIFYLDTDYAAQTETITLNGTTPVNTVATNILRINAFHVTSVGSGGVSVGNLSLTNTGSTVTYGYITAGNNSSRQAIYTIPAGKTGYLTHWQASSGATTGTHFTRISVRSTSYLGALLSGVFLTVDEQGTLNGGGSFNYPIPLKFPAMADVKVSAISDSASANAYVMSALFGWFE